MPKKNILALAVGIGLFALLAVLIALRTMPSGTSGDAPDAASANAAFGSLRLPESINHFQADGANGTVTIGSGKPAERLIAGQYHVRYWQVERQDDRGDKWILTGQYFGQDNPFEIKADNETKLDVGEPIIATVDARNSGSTYSFNQVIKGRHEEIVELSRNGSRPQPPKLNIKNEDGSYDKTFSFEYG